MRRTSRIHLIEQQLTALAQRHGTVFSGSFNVKNQCHRVLTGISTQKYKKNSTSAGVSNLQAIFCKFTVPLQKIWKL